jgi:PAS domain S-box-containing protein
MVQTDLATGRFVRANPRMCEITGYPEEELLGLTFADITHPDDRGADSETLARLVEGETLEYQTENRYVRKDGSVVWVSVDARAVRDEAGRPVRAVAAVQDITGRKENEERLERQARLLDLTQDAMIVWVAEDGEISFWNRAAEEMYGWTESEALGENVHALLETWFPETLERAQAELFENGRWEGELWHTTRDGATLIVASRWVLEHGEPSRVLETNTEIGKRRRNEEALKASLKELSDLKFALDESAIVAFTDQKGRITYVNDKFCEVSKYSRDELIGQDHRIINSAYHPKDFIRDL